MFEVVVPKAKPNTEPLRVIGYDAEYVEPPPNPSVEVATGV